MTGAGGSIGSQLCREICTLNPSKIILFELSEPSLYNIYQELKGLNSTSIDIIPILGNATDFNLVNKVITENKVNIIFHAAAYKHVPMVEMNPLQGIKNNVISTRLFVMC